MRHLKDLDVHDKRVLVRVDFNVPLDEQGRVSSDARIKAALPTLTYLHEQGARIILMSHLGRPKGRVVDSLRMGPVGERLAELTGWEVVCAPDCVGPEVQDLAQSLLPGHVLLLENLRFHPQETQGDEEFARALASLGEVYVNDAFGTCHRAHASVAVVPRFLPSAPGFLLEAEIQAFQKILHNPDHPYVAILGGAKVSDKLPVLTNLLPRVDRLLIGGAMAYTFLAAQGIEVGQSRVEEELITSARLLLQTAQSQGKQLLLPVDHVAAVHFAEDSPYEITGPGIPDGLMGLDIGPRTRIIYKEALADAKTILWNGPMGVFEWPEFRKGTEAIAQDVATADAYSVVGGGDSVAALELLGLQGNVSHVSTGGGASLELLEGKTLPGIQALEQA
ncbi:MAG TPA: phosphoglycerate kinase [Planctomycetes bacterium]|nr:phosphoglycerate kinase [Planctomycetota bacterium]